MNVSFRYGHVNDLANIKAKDAALVELRALVEHWKADRAAGLFPSEATLNHAHRLVSNALEGRA